MAGKRKTPLWRQTFLRALARTGNVRASAFEAGVDKVTAYNHRRKDAGFAGKWDAALAKFKNRPSPRPRSRPPDGTRPRNGRGSRAGGFAVERAPRVRGSAGRRSGSELVLRRTRHGDKLVRASPGRWSGRVEESFLEGLELTGCVRGAAAAAGISTAALYERRKHYPEFAERWDEVAGRAGRELPAMLGAAARESLSRPPEAPGEKRRGRARLPRVDVDQAIRISAIAAKKEASGRGRGRDWREVQRRHEQTNEELVQTLMVLLDGMDARQRKARLGEGWQDAGNGLLLPPGWVRDGGRANGDSHE